MYGVKKPLKQNDLPFHVIGKSSKKSVAYTAGAVPVLNDKGELTMEKVSVKRYIAGKKPDFARDDDSNSDDENEYNDQLCSAENISIKKETCDIIYQSKDKVPKLNDKVNDNAGKSVDESDDENNNMEEDEDEETIEKRRQHLRQIALRNRKNQIEALEYSKDDINNIGMFLKPNLVPESKDFNYEISNNEVLQDMVELEEVNHVEEEEDDDYANDSDESDEVLFKPVFVKKSNRQSACVNIAEALTSSTILNMEDDKAIKLKSQRRKDSRLLIQDIIKEELANEHGINNKDDIILTDGENEDDDTNFALWKIRELKRIKREADRKEQSEEEKRNIERLRNMTEEERLLELKLNPKVFTNKQEKGKYSYLQKYFHRGAFYLDEEDVVYKRNFAAPTLEDHFDKSILPKVMQVKNFGKAGRTKYTHLVDQDTTQFDSAWVTEKELNSKFSTQHCGGFKQKFTRPARK